MRLLLPVTAALGLLLGGCASEAVPKAGAVVRSIIDITVCDPENESIRRTGDDGTFIQLGCALSQRPGQMLIVQESPTKQLKLRNDPRKNGFFKVGDRVVYPAESIWLRLAQDLPWIKLAPH
jgi:hypothetical protein